MLHWLELHNRALKDDGLPEVPTSMLCYHLLKAIPASEAALLRPHFVTAAKSPNPFEDLCQTAKAHEQLEPKSMFLARAGGEQDQSNFDPEETMYYSRNDTNNRRRDYQPQRQSNSNFRKRDREESSCPWCGRQQCRNRDECPASGCRCNNCGKTGHFASVCRSSNRNDASNDKWGSRGRNGKLDANSTPKGSFRGAPNENENQ